MSVHLQPPVNKEYLRASSRFHYGTPLEGVPTEIYKRELRVGGRAFFTPQAYLDEVILHTGDPNTHVVLLDHTTNQVSN